MECDKLSEEVLRGREEFATLRCKYQLTAEDAEEKVRAGDGDGPQMWVRYYLPVCYRQPINI